MPQLEPRQAGAKVTPEMIKAGVRFVMDFFSAEWGGKRGISQTEAECLLSGAFEAMGTEVASVQRPAEDL